jgi:hypothetical protein
MSETNLGEMLAHYKAESEVLLLEHGSTHTLRCTKAVTGTAAKGATIMPVFEVAVGPQAGARVMTGKLSFSKEAAWKTVPIIKGFGLTDEFLQQAQASKDPIAEIAKALEGRVVEAKVKVNDPKSKVNRSKLRK